MIKWFKKQYYKYQLRELETEMFLKSISFGYYEKWSQFYQSELEKL